MLTVKIRHFHDMLHFQRARVADQSSVSSRDYESEGFEVGGLGSRFGNEFCTLMKSD